MGFKEKFNNFGRKAENIAIFNKAMKVIDSSEVLKKATEESIEKSFLFDVKDWSEPKERSGGITIEVTPESSFHAALRIRKANREKKIAVLNFASAKNPGGMVKAGSSAQEECLCRVSNLYRVLSDKKFSEHYKNGTKGDDKYLYIDECIYSPDIEVILDLDTSEILETPWSVDVITAAFPNLRHYSDKKIQEMDEVLDEVYNIRIENVFQAAAKEGVDVLILGAWGCGVFRNDPEKVAKAFERVQKKYLGIFNMIIYPVFCRNVDEDVNFQAFAKILG